MTSLSPTFTILYRFLQVYALIFAVFSGYFGQWGTMMNMLIILVLTTTVLSLRKHVRELCGHILAQKAYIDQYAPLERPTPEEKEVEGWVSIFTDED